MPMLISVYTGIFPLLTGVSIFCLANNSSTVFRKEADDPLLQAMMRRRTGTTRRRTVKRIMPNGSTRRSSAPQMSTPGRASASTKWPHCSRPCCTEALTVSTLSCRYCSEMMFTKNDNRLPHPLGHLSITVRNLDGPMIWTP